MTAVCFPMLAATIDRLEGRPPAAQLQVLEALCVEHGGTWSIPQPAPQGARRYAPVLYEMSLFGVAAMADDIEALPRNWMKAARSLLIGTAGAAA